MIAAAYRYAEDGGETPREIESGRLIDRFGAQAVYGRTLGVKEMRRITVAENVARAYEIRQSSSDWVKWSKDNPELSKLLEYGAVLNRENHGG